MESVIRYVSRPKLNMYGGIKVSKDTEFTTVSDDGTIKQTVKDLLLTTEVNIQHEDELNTKEYSLLTQELQEGYILIWTEDKGYMVTDSRSDLVPIEQAVEEYKILEGVMEDDIKANEGSNTQIN